MTTARLQPVKLGSVNGAEIFGAGVYRDKAYTIQDLDEIVRNFEELGPDGLNLLNPPAVLGHEEHQEFLEKSDLPAAGWLKNVRRVGSLLIGDFSEVPLSVARMLKSKAFRKISVELYGDFKDDTGKGYGQAIRRVAFLGAEVPMVKRLKDIPDVTFSERIKARLKCGECYSSSARGTFICFSEVTVDRPALVAAVKAAMPNYDQAILDSMTDEQIAELVKNMTPPAAPVETPAAMADEPAAVSREDMIADLVAAGEDAAALDAMSDEEINALYDTLTAGTTTEMSDVDGVEMSREEMLAALVSAGQDPATLEPLTDEELAAMLRKPAAPVTPMSDKTKKPVARPVLAIFAEARKTLSEIKKSQSAIKAEQDKLERDRAVLKKTGIENFCDQLIKDGKLAPVDRDDRIEFLMGKDDTRIEKFSENGAELQMTALERKKRELAARPKIIHFGERIKEKGQGQNTEDEEVNKIIRFSEKYGETFPGRDLVAQFRELRKKNPKATAKQYIGSDLVEE